MKTIFLIGNETPMDLLLLSLFLKGKPQGELILGVKRDTPLNWKKLLKVWKIFRASGSYFVGFNVVLNSKKGLMFMQDSNIIPPDVETMRQEYKFPLFYFHDVNAPRTLSIIKDFAPDVIFNHMPQRICLPLIQIPPLGIVNIHPGLLPEYQGMGSCLWPLINKAHFQGVTLHYIDSEEIDAGPIIASGRFPIKEKDSVLSLHIKNRIVAAVVANYIANRFFRNEAVKSKPQGGGEYHKLPQKKSLRLMRNMGHKYISWNDRKILSENMIGNLDFFDETTGWKWKQYNHKGNQERILKK
ncbi:MAG: formyltransferase family protein [Nitrospirota bacterium]